MNRGRGKFNADGQKKRGGDSKRKSSGDRSKPKSAKPGSSKSRGKGKYVDFKEKQRKGDTLPSFGENVRLNKFLSNAGIASRREADVLISTGVVTVNGEIVTEMGYKVKPGDEVKYDGHTIKTATKRYVLLNKPKGYVTSMNDPFGRKNAYGLIQKACKEAVFPMGKMDKDTTGLVLYTNDSDLDKKMSHPKHKPVRLYHVELNKKVQPEDMEKLRSGVLLEDGTIQFEKAEYVNGSEMYEIGIEVSSTKSQVVRRAMEALGYVVTKLDRVTFAGLTKKDLPRGHYRLLNEKEVAFLKMK
ncbi:MAG: RNA-binding S4 domain-containing protein [Flavobacteriales bacterium]|nr:RNA-binding S4 domain-containing protein [Flavobacteriales bacterium]